jgi:hypothetical protein
VSGPQVQALDYALALAKLAASVRLKQEVRYVLLVTLQCALVEVVPSRNVSQTPSSRLSVLLVALLCEVGPVLGCHPEVSAHLVDTRVEVLEYLPSSAGHEIVGAKNAMHPSIRPLRRG